MQRVLAAARDDVSRMEQEVAVQQSIAATKELELEQLTHTAAADIESFKLEIGNQKDQLAEAKAATKAAEQEAIELRV